MPHTDEWKAKWKKPEIQHGVMTAYNFLVHYPEGLRLGKYIDISQFVYIQSRYGVEIEDDVEIGPFCALLSESTEDEKQGLVKICRNAKIGTHSTIMPGVTVGENSVIGAYSFVNKDIPPNVVAWGIPCKVQKDLKSEKE